MVYLVAGLCVFLVGLAVAATIFPMLHRADAQSALEVGVAAFDADHFDAARRILLPLARSGNSAAESLLADMDENGLGQPRDMKAAIGWYTKAGQADSVTAERRLGQLYLSGQGILQDVDEARIWLSRAAEQGDPVSQRLLGEIYAKGLGVQKDPTLAYAWLDIAASRGDLIAERERDDLLPLLSSAALAQAETVAQDKLQSIDNSEELHASADGSAPKQGKTVGLPSLSGATVPDARLLSGRLTAANRRQSASLNQDAMESVPARRAGS
jgi:uncharacterized protein